MLDGQNFVIARADIDLSNAQAHLELCQKPNGCRITQIKLCGHLVLGDLSNILGVLESHCSFDVASPTLWDLRDFDWRAQDAAHFRASLFSLRKFPKRRNTRRGVLVSDQLGFGMARMYQESAEGYGIENAKSFMISYSRSDLIPWLCEG